MNNTCGDHEPDWKACALGELTAPERREAETHLAACDACRDEHAQRFAATGAAQLRRPRGRLCVCAAAALAKLGLRSAPAVVILPRQGVILRQLSLGEVSNADKAGGAQ